MAQEWEVISRVADGLTVVACLAIFAFIMVTGRLHTKQHTEDVVDAVKDGAEAVLAAKSETIRNLQEELARAVTREEAARRELSEMTTVMGRLEGTVREAINMVRRR